MVQKKYLSWIYIKSNITQNLWRKENNGNRI
jgi:hypothetical protein